MELQASREHYCVHKRVSKAPNRDEECEKLLRDQPARPAAHASGHARLMLAHDEPHADRVSLTLTAPRRAASSSRMRTSCMASRPAHRCMCARFLPPQAPTAFAAVHAMLTPVAGYSGPRHRGLGQGRAGQLRVPLLRIAPLCECAAGARGACSARSAARGPASAAASGVRPGQRARRRLGATRTDSHARKSTAVVKRRAPRTCRHGRRARDGGGGGGGGGGGSGGGGGGGGEQAARTAGRRRANTGAHPDGCRTSPRARRPGGASGRRRSGPEAQACAAGRRRADAGAHPARPWPCASARACGRRGRCREAPAAGSCRAAVGPGGGALADGQTVSSGCAGQQGARRRQHSARRRRRRRRRQAGGRACGRRPAGVRRRQGAAERARRQAAGRSSGRDRGGSGPYPPRVPSRARVRGPAARPAARAGAARRARSGSRQRPARWRRPPLAAAHPPGAPRRRRRRRARRMRSGRRVGSSGARGRHWRRVAASGCFAGQAAPRARDGVQRSVRAG